MTDKTEKYDAKDSCEKDIIPSFINPKVFATSKKLNEKKLKSKNENVEKKKKVLLKNEHGFMYIGHLPHGFYENEIKSYFSQFGRIVKIRLARSIKSGNHKGYGFIEFENIEVAKIAADTMNNYLMFNKILKCHIIPREKLNKNTFKNSKKSFFVKMASTLRKKFNATKTKEQFKVYL
jgi:nucleolar protein 15